MSNFEEHEHVKNLMKSLANMKELCDVILVADKDKQKFPAHRLVLRASSKYFDALLGPNFREGTKQNIVLKGIDGPTLKKIIDFIYTGRITIDNGSVVNIVSAASRMELVSLKERCAKFWENNLKIENCVDVLVNADKYQFKALLPKALEFIRENFETVPADDIPKIHKEHFQALLKHDQLSAAETTIFERVVLWINQNKAKKANFESSFLKLIRLRHIPIEFLVKNVEPLFIKHKQMQSIMEEYRDRALHPNAMRSNRRYTSKSIYYAAVNTQNVLDIQKYDHIKNNWSAVKSLPVQQTTNFGAGMVVVNDQLFVMGGTVMDNMCFSYSLINYSREQLPNMINARSQFTPISIGNFIYVFSGWGIYGGSMVECERYDIGKRVWQSRRAIPIRAHNHAAIEVNGQIYVSTNGILNCSFYCYNPELDTWTQKASVGLCLSLAKSNNILYAMKSDNTLHQYDSTQNKWTQIGAYSSSGTLFYTIGHCGRIFVLSQKEGIAASNSNIRERVFVTMKSINLSYSGLLYLY